MAASGTRAILTNDIYKICILRAMTLLINCFQILADFCQSVVQSKDNLIQHTHGQMRKHEMFLIVYSLSAADHYGADLYCA